MTTAVGAAIAAFLLLSWAVDAICALLYRARMQAARATASGDRLPKAAVLMMLRGADPELPEAIAAVLRQDYPRFDLHVIVDDERDPAWPIVVEALRVRPGASARLDVLRDRTPTRSLVCSSALQFLDQVDPSCEVVAFCAGDMIVPPTWLRDMATALLDPRIGATLGNRWFASDGTRWGSLVTYVLNAAGAVQAWMAGIPWSGALMLRVRDIRSGHLDDRWRAGMVEDVPASDAIRDLGLWCRHVPQLMIHAGREWSLVEALTFARRQQFWIRLYHRGWPLLFSYSVLSAARMIVPAVAAAWLLAIGRSTLAVAVIGATIAYVVASVVNIDLIDGGVRGATGAPRLSMRARWRRAVRLVPVIPFAAVTAAILALSCCGARTIEWRGVRYRIEGPWDVRLVADARRE